MNVNFPTFSMYTMMNTIGWNTGFSIFYGLHILSVIVFLFGMLFLLRWAFKHLAEKDLWKWGWRLVAIGIVACLLTLPFWPSFAMDGFGGMMRGGQRFSGMVETTQEEADGKALYEQLQSKQTNCKNVSDDDFELMGEYFMSQRLGAAHLQMNAMMQQMMGADGEEQMHIIMGQRLSGCATNSVSPR